MTVRPGDGLQSSMWLTGTETPGELAEVKAARMLREATDGGLN